MEVMPKPHGNSLSSLPFFRTAETAKTRHKEIAERNTPKTVMQIATMEQGGELEAKGLNKLPRIVEVSKKGRECIVQCDGSMQGM